MNKSWPRDRTNRIPHPNLQPEYELLNNVEGEPYGNSTAIDRRSSLSFKMDRYQGAGVLGLGYAAHAWAMGAMGPGVPRRVRRGRGNGQGGELHLDDMRRFLQLWWSV